MLRYNISTQLLCTVLFFTSAVHALSEFARSKNFVYLSEVDPTILISPRYATRENFVGKIIDGYKKPVIILTRQAADALKSVHDELKQDGYNLVVYDAYRPQKAVDHFVRWSKDSKDQVRKWAYYPRVDKATLLSKSYIALPLGKSGHSRGSTVDLTIIQKGHKLHPVRDFRRKLSDGFVITILDDGTVDMGSSFDLFDTASHYKNSLINAKYKSVRTYLKNIMEKHGFKNYAEEWWHFTLKNEPYAPLDNSSYFNFDVE